MKSPPKNPILLPNTDTHLFTSVHTNRSYKIFVVLPNDYDQSEEHYPVVYFMFGNENASRFHAILPRIGIAPVIAVGIGYPSDDPQERFIKYLEDFSTPSPKYQQLVKEMFGLAFNAGGADHFLAFIRDQLFPFIHKNYRASEQSRTFYGYSAGGGFGVFALLKHPETFHNYVIGAPSLHWDDRMVFEAEQEYAEQHTDLPVHLYFGVGVLDEDDWEHNASSLTDFQARIKARNYPSLKMHFEVYNGENHDTSSIPCIVRGLRAIFS